MGGCILRPFELFSVLPPRAGEYADLAFEIAGPSRAVFSCGKFEVEVNATEIGEDEGGPFALIQPTVNSDPPDFSINPVPGRIECQVPHPFPWVPGPFRFDLKIDENGYVTSIFLR